MPNPTKKHTRTSKRNRRPHMKIKTKVIIKCEKCLNPVLPHHACLECGNYNGRSIFSKVYDKKDSVVETSNNQIV